MKLTYYAVVGLWALTATFVSSMGIAVAESEVRSATLVLGRVSSDPKKTAPRLESLASYLVPHLASVGINKGDVLVARDTGQMIEFLREGRVDLVSETPMGALFMEAAGDAQVLLREWKKGVSEYFTVFLSRQTAEIRTLKDLVGRKIAFEDRGSTTGFYLPLAALRRAGLSAIELPDPEAVVPPGKVGYVFAENEINIAAWVDRGLTDAGAYSNLDWLDRDRVTNTMRNNLVVFHETAPILRSVVLVRSGLAEDIRRRTAEVLLSMHEDPKAQPVLRKYFKVRRFDAFEGEALRSLEEARAVFARIRESVE